MDVPSTEAFVTAWDIVAAGIAGNHTPESRLGHLIAFFRDANQDGLLQIIPLEGLDETALQNIGKTHAGFIFGHQVAWL